MEGRMQIIWGRYLITMNRERQILEDSGVCCDGDTIKDVGPITVLRARYPNASEVGGANVAVLPGLVNSHMHLCCSLFRGYIDDLPLLEHDVRFLFPGQRAMTQEHVYHASLLSAVELLKNGITTTADAYLLPEASARALVDSGMRGIVSPAMMDVWLGGELGPVISTTAEAINGVRNLHERFHGAGSGRIAVWPAPFTDLSASPELIRSSGDLAREWGAGIQIHLAETLEGVNLVKRRHGKRVVEYVDACGLLNDTRVVAAHCCWVTEPDIAILKARDVAVAYCPSSEMKMADGIPPVGRLLSEGVCVSVAIDATCVNNSADLLRETKIGAMLQKVVYPFDAEIVPAEQALELITTEPARALGLESVVGSLEIGKKADIIALRIDRAHYVPLLNTPRPTIINHLVYAASGADVSEVFVDGVHLIADGTLRVLDEKSLVADAQTAITDFVRVSGIDREINALKWLPRRVSDAGSGDGRAAPVMASADGGHHA
jgi:5-methylthioadenosine/S-adenosylhomocysteine deaminase